MTFQKADIYTFLSVSAVRGGGGGEGARRQEGVGEEGSGRSREERRVVVGVRSGWSSFSFSILPPSSDLLLIVFFTTFCGLVSSLLFSPFVVR